MEERSWDICNEKNLKTLLVENAWVLEVSETDDSTVPNAPMEDGSFSAYNKIPVPRRLSIKIGCDGTLASRMTFERTVREAKSSLDTFWIYSPTADWRNMTIESVSKTVGEGNGLSISVFDIEFAEIVQRRMIEMPMAKPAQVKDKTNVKTADSGSKQGKSVSDTIKAQLSKSMDFAIGGA